MVQAWKDHAFTSSHSAGCENYPWPLGSIVATGRLGTLCPEGCGDDLGEQLFISVRRRLPLVICWDLYRFEFLFYTGSNSLSPVVVRTEKK